MDKIKDLLLNGHEGYELDFKAVQYSPAYLAELIKDIVAMANCHIEGDKYIVIGVKERSEGNEYKGIPPEEFIDSAVYAEAVHNHVEPELTFEYFKYEYDGKLFGIFKIFNSENKPYMIKKKIGKWQEGDSWIRRGSRNDRLKRPDFDRIYEGREQIDIAFCEEELFARKEEYGCASIEVCISNYSKKPITIISGSFQIIDLNGRLRTRHSVRGWKEYSNNDFKLSLKPFDEEVGHIFVNFESNDALLLRMNEFGNPDQEFFKFRLILRDARGKEYIKETVGSVFAQGEVLWKVQKFLEKPKGWLGRRR
ncbi:AlbA family DNA-binding domain-containing protein [Saccharibacillus alkalitolerans]|uniref:ATP-binding protein n=1 Tax=Saccharibacillus alkalitolerans TaxID=2705290 RepID=A0ABX0F4P1_9BACL|nr:ATP-binding protein [Saccharibacillus alkalitolerans]NGZ74979.1 ATP-binding protein [Saccharibacillus alkalitolerans]